MTFANGVRFQSISVFIINDTVFENPEEFSGRLTTTDSRVSIVNSEATAVIIDNDNGKLKNLLKV